MRTLDRFRQNGSKEEEDPKLMESVSQSILSSEIDNSESSLDTSKVKKINTTQMAYVHPITQ